MRVERSDISELFAGALDLALGNHQLAQPHAQHDLARRGAAWNQRLGTMQCQRCFGDAILGQQVRAKGATQRGLGLGAPRNPTRCVADPQSPARARPAPLSLGQVEMGYRAIGASSARLAAVPPPPADPDRAARR